MAAQIQPKSRLWLTMQVIMACFAMFFARELRAELPSPVLSNIFPAGGQVGTSFTVTVVGTQHDELAALRFSDPRIRAEKKDGNQFAATVPPDMQPGVYDARVVAKYGVSGPRAFLVGNRPERGETEPNDGLEKAQPVELNVVVNGRLEKPGDIDCYRFTARAGQRVVLEAWAERIDSPLHGVLEVFNSEGRRLAVNRGYAGLDPLVDFRVPAEGNYVARLFDQTYSGGADYVYRLDIDTGPRVEFTVPAVVREGQAGRVTLVGRNLVPQPTTTDAIDRLEVELSPFRPAPLPLPLRPAQSVLSGFPYYHAGSHLPVLIGTTDVPVVLAAQDNDRPERAQVLSVPCEVSGQLTGGDDRAWFAVQALRGDVLWIEGLGARLGSPLDLDVAVLSSDERELVRLTDHVENLGGTRFPTNHSDPAGRFVAPANGKYLVLVRNLIGGVEVDSRRIYRLAVRREEPDFQLTLVPRRSDVPTGLNVWRGGRELADVFAVRRRGMSGPIRVAAENLPPGFECPDVWLGPNEEHAVVVFSAGRDTSPGTHSLTLVGRAEVGGVELTRPVRGGTMVRAGHPTGWGRLTSEITLGIAPEASVLVSATPDTANVFQDSIFDVLVEVERRAGADGPIHLSGVGLPHGMESPVATISAGSSKGWLSFAVPASLIPGPYSFAIQAETETTAGGAKLAVTTFSSAVTLQVAPARIQVTIDPRTPKKIARGQVIHVRYKAERKHGFIGKIHTELAAPGGVVGIRGRGVTFTGQTEAGDIQIIATENAAVGQLIFLRLDAIGTVEDQPIYRGSRFLELEITE